MPNREDGYRAELFQRDNGQRYEKIRGSYTHVRNVTGRRQPKAGMEIAGWTGSESTRQPS